MSSVFVSQSLNIFSASGHGIAGVGSRVFSFFFLLRIVFLFGGIIELFERGVSKTNRCTLYYTRIISGMYVPARAMAGGGGGSRASFFGGARGHSRECPACFLLGVLSFCVCLIFRNDTAGMEAG